MIDQRNRGVASRNVHKMKDFCNCNIRDLLPNLKKCVKLNFRLDKNCGIVFGIDPCTTYLSVTVKIRKIKM